MSYGAEFPPIVIAGPVHERLSRMTRAGLRQRRAPPVAELLSFELSRALIVPSEEVPPAILGMHMPADIENDIGQIRRVTLIYPDEFPDGPGQLSVMTPLGTALLGLSEGDSMPWRSPCGEWRRVRLARVLHDSRKGGSL